MDEYINFLRVLCLSSVCSVDARCAECQMACRNCLTLISIEWRKLSGQELSMTRRLMECHNCYRLSLSLLCNNTYFHAASFSLEQVVCVLCCVNSRPIGSLRRMLASHALLDQSVSSLCHRSYSGAPPSGLPLVIAQN